MQNPKVKKPDRLSALISRFHVHARVRSFVPKSLALQTAEDIEAEVENDANFFIAQLGQLGSQIKKGIKGQVSPSGATASGLELEGIRDDVLLLVFYPRGVPSTETRRGGIKKDVPADHLVPEGYVCAAVDTGGVANPIALALPDLVVVRLDQSKPLQAVANMLMEEANAPRCGGQAVIDRLCEIVVIRLLRHLIEAGQAEVGLLAGLAHPNLALAIVAIHDNPERNFHLEDLAEIAAMSRTHFVNSFRKSVGVTPGQYLSNWRLTLARMEIAKGTPLKAIARRIGFSSSAALSRAFTRHYGVNPRTEMP
ncbi:MAG: AraC family transcriptional regulator [Halopseudomonas aestusnigri]